MAQIKYHWPEAIRQQTAEILAPFSRVEEWEALQIPGMETPFASVLLTGAPGTGKTTLAKQILKSIAGIRASEVPMLAMGDVASEKLGQTERSIMAAFRGALHKQKVGNAKIPVLFIDECDAISWNRANVTSSSMFFLSIVNTLLIQIDKFLEAGGALVFATNFPELLDPALVRRMTDKIELIPPSGEDAIKVWKSLMPPQPFGLEVNAKFVSQFHGWNVNQIQKWITTEVRKAFLAERTMNNLYDGNHNA